MKIIGGIAGLMFLMAVAAGCSATKNNTTRVQTQPTPIVESSAEAPIHNSAAATEQEPLEQIQVEQATEPEVKHTGCGGGY